MHLRGCAWPWLEHDVVPCVQVVAGEVYCHRRLRDLRGLGWERHLPVLQTRESPPLPALFCDCLPLLTPVTHSSVVRPIGSLRVLFFKHSDCCWRARTSPVPRWVVRASPPHGHSFVLRRPDCKRRVNLPKSRRPPPPRRRANV